MSGLCGGCRYWEFDDYETGKREGHEPQRRWGQCKLARSHNGYGDVPASLAQASDAECYAANLNTVDRFGCVQFERR